MSMLDKLKGMIKSHEDQAGKGIEKAGDMVDKKTGGKYQGQVDSAQEKMHDQLGTRKPNDQP